MAGCTLLLGAGRGQSRRKRGIVRLQIGVCARPRPTGHGPASTQEEANERARGRRMQLAAWCMRGADDTAARVRALPGAAFNARAATDGLEQGLCSATGASGTYCTLQPPVNHVRSRAWRVATGDPAGAAGH